MTEKRTTTNQAQPTPAQTSPNKTALFLETTVQFHRLVGPTSFQKTIKELISSSEKVGTSAHVKREFDFVYGGFFDSVIDNVGRLPGQSRERNVSEMWMDVAHLMRKHFYGGPMVLMKIGMTLAEKFGSKPIAPTRLLNVLGGLRLRLLRGFKKGDFFFDKSSCGEWDEPCSCQCYPEPDDACRLKEICVTMRAQFLASVKTLAGKNREESKWLRENLHLLEAAHGRALIKLITKHPGHVGDPIIFWETPDNWTILTRDLTFRILQKAHRNEVKVYITRPARNAGGGKCKVLPESAVQEVEGVLLDHNAQGARVRAPGASVKSRKRVTIKSRAFGSNGNDEISREGKVAYLDKQDPSVFAVRFPSK
jgi:hypothetical protein